MEADNAKRSAKRKWHGTHHSWSYRPEAFRWTGERIVGINFLPLAHEMRTWLTRTGDLHMPPEESPELGGYSNPYTVFGASLALVLSQVINSWHHYSTSQSGGLDALDAEIERLRLHNEIVLYAARFCEISIKQLLHCSTVPARRYKYAGLGSLLESPCPLCKKREGSKRHFVSLVGTLAHPFHQCLEFEQCAMDHMALVNKLRNSRAAHSEIQPLNVRTVEESKAQLFSECDDVLSGFAHMLSHLAKLEIAMLDDLAEKGEAITLLKLNGLPPEECNFKLTPGQRFVFEPIASD